MKEEDGEARWEGSVSGRTSPIRPFLDSLSKGPSSESCSYGNPGISLVWVDKGIQASQQCSKEIYLFPNNQGNLYLKATFSQTEGK